MTPRVGVVGAGYVGLTTAVCLAAKGIDTTCLDTDARRVADLRRGNAVIDEPQLDVLLRAGLDGGSLRFADDYGDLTGRDIVFICVPTPTGDNGCADLRAVDRAVGTLTYTHGAPGDAGDQVDCAGGNLPQLT